MSRNRIIMMELLQELNQRNADLQKQLATEAERIAKEKAEAAERLHIQHELIERNAAELQRQFTAEAERIAAQLQRNLVAEAGRMAAEKAAQLTAQEHLRLEAEQAAELLQQIQDQEQLQLEEMRRELEENELEHCRRADILQEAQQHERQAIMQHLLREQQYNEHQQQLEAYQFQRNQYEANEARRQWAMEAAIYEEQVQLYMIRQEAEQQLQQHLHRQQNYPIAHKPYEDPPEHHSLGPMAIPCQHCRALHFDSEKLTSSTLANIKFGSCCLQGQIDLPAFPDPPADLRNLLVGINPISKTFRENIRQYNKAFAFTSLGVNKIEHLGNGPYTFKIKGALHHLSGHLQAQPGVEPKFAQIYIHEHDEQSEICRRNNPNLWCPPVIMTSLQAMLHNTHPYVPLYKHAFMIMEQAPDQYPTVQVRLHVNQAEDQQRYNLPTANEIAVMVPGDGSEELSNDRDIVLQKTGGGFRKISHLHPSYSALQYPLLFPHGEDGIVLDCLHTLDLLELDVVRILVNNATMHTVFILE
ncbi:hypothetical protein BDQ12DRAFT_729341 [Crucibulum laeve]|uniref:Helitron helicase-like domain-containing protein n=1 Tax=Crucibulum laeve TaxID=68775 RepID=A0A5C3LGF9_9AGAR|nr:hypothetical protein BDQ12DRAFT_729341 [Crucibulum laeve]